MLMFLPQGRPGADCTVDWVGLGASVDDRENVTALGFDPQTILPVASHYTEYNLPYRILCALCVSWVCVVVAQKFVEFCCVQNQHSVF